MCHNTPGNSTFLFVCLFVHLIVYFGCMVVTCKICDQTVPICSSSIKCMSKILYNFNTMLLTPNGPLLRSQFDKNKFKTRTFQETMMRIRNVKVLWCPDLLDLDIDDVIGCCLFACLVA